MRGVYYCLSFRRLFVPSALALTLAFWWSSSLFFFFFKQKTAYEMRISDWSSDVCSSDLPSIKLTNHQLRLIALVTNSGKFLDEASKDLSRTALVRISCRSEERRVGKECVSTCRSRWSRYH